MLRSQVQIQLYLAMFSFREWQHKDTSSSPALRKEYLSLLTFAGLRWQWGADDYSVSLSLHGPALGLPQVLIILIHLSGKLNARLQASLFLVILLLRRRSCGFNQLGSRSLCPNQEGEHFVCVTDSPGLGKNLYVAVRAAHSLWLFWHQHPSFLFFALQLTK